MSTQSFELKASTATGLVQIGSSMESNLEQVIQQRLAE